MLPWNETLIIIPTYNEAGNIGPMIAALFQLYPEVSMLIVDDDSPDETALVVEQMKASQVNLHLIKRVGKRGLAGAYIEGFRWARARSYNYIFEMDCDFSHDPKQAEGLLAQAREHHVVIGSRYIGGVRIINWPFKRLLLSYCASLYVRLVLSVAIFDPTSGFKCFTRKALEALDLDRIISRGYIFQVEVNYQLLLLGFEIKEVPITFEERREGKSKMGGGIIWESFFSVLQLRLLNMLDKLLRIRKNR